LVHLVGLLLGLFPDDRSKIEIGYNRFSICTVKETSENRRIDMNAKLLFSFTRRKSNGDLIILTGSSK